jgi:hypothetical protein
MFRPNNIICNTGYEHHLKMDISEKNSYDFDLFKMINFPSIVKNDYMISSPINMRIISFSNDSHEFQREWIEHPVILIQCKKEETLDVCLRAPRYKMICDPLPYYGAPRIDEITYSDYSRIIIAINPYEGILSISLCNNITNLEVYIRYHISNII